MSFFTPGDEDKAWKDENIMTETENTLVNEEEIQPHSLAENTKLMSRIYKLAQIYARSGIIPVQYQGKPENCFVAIELAGRMNVSPTLVMQNLVVVQGRPSWSGQACIALINGSGKFSHDLDFITVGQEGEKNWGCYCKTTRKADGRELIGTTITMAMAEQEGWLNKNGSKWKTMPAQMLKYRAAAFFARVFCPDVLMGFNTVDEAQEIAQDTEKITIKLKQGEAGAHAE